MDVNKQQAKINFDCQMPDGGSGERSWEGGGGGGEGEIDMEK